MKTRIILIFVLIIILGCPSFAYVKPEIYKGVQVRNYGERECTHILEMIPDNYLEGLNAVSFMTQKPFGINGGYYSSKIIYVHTGCDIEVLVHELAHHCEYHLMNHTWYESSKHAKGFESCKEDIWESTLIG